ILAKAHARTGNPAAIAGYCGRSGRLDEAILRFALAYADQTERDHARLVEAIRKRDIAAASEFRLRRIAQPAPGAVRARRASSLRWLVPHASAGSRWAFPGGRGGGGSAPPRSSSRSDSANSA